MTNPGAGSEGIPDEPNGIPFASEDVWLRFLMDSEDAIRASAPRELSAQERTSAGQPRHPDTDGPERRARRPLDGASDPAADAVGELWQPDAPWPTWRELDGRARVRRVGRVLATAAAMALALGAWSALSTGKGIPGDEPGQGTVEQLEEAPAELPATMPLPSGPAAAGPSSSTSAFG